MVVLLYDFDILELFTIYISGFLFKFVPLLLQSKVNIFFSLALSYLFTQTNVNCL